MKSTKLTLEAFNLEAQRIQDTYNGTARIMRLESLTNKFYGDDEAIKTLNVKHERNAGRVNAEYEDLESESGEIIWVNETPVDTMIAQGNNQAWYDAIILAEINASAEGLNRTILVSEARNVSATKVRTRAVRAKKADENSARIKKRQKLQKSRGFASKQKRAVCVPPSKRA